MKILVIEDEVKTANFLKKGLSEAGFVVDVAVDGLGGLYMAKEVDFDLVILDVMLPTLDGWQVLTRLRQADRQTLVLLLTARDAVHERVRGFDLGADDYLVKPFAFSELLARVRAALDNVAATTEHEDTVVVFSHGGVINVVLHEILGTRRILSFPIDYVSLTRLLFSRSGEASVVAVNGTFERMATPL